ncbi:glycosyltransferase [Caenispirillum salinarum]|uniref:glycosyltransferase n=1 Tax=Caenispirillum salinarum TaxID=859058 RepID=UPI003850416F
MTLETLALIALCLAVLPLALTLLNLPFFRRAPARADTGELVSVLIPARDEAANIEAAVRSVLADGKTPLEVVVLDDHSTDGTADIVRRLAAEDGRVRLETAPPLPGGWSGKQHACHALSRRARGDILLFMDADVRLEPGAPGRFAACFADPRLHLVSGFPREETKTLGERLIIPQIHVLLLGYLPMFFARLFRRTAAFAAGCGQLMAVRREAYDAMCGHGAPSVKASMHDGVTLPRAFRRAGYATGVVEAADLARCRMYEGFAATWDGFSKNATEGMATPVGLPVWTVLLAGGHILPWLLIPAALVAGSAVVAWMGLAGVLATLAQRAVLAVRSRQDWRAVPWHPVGIAVLLALQWVALVRSWRGHRPSWRGRTVARGEDAA